MKRAFFQDQVRPFSGGEYILAQVNLVDITPDVSGGFDGVFIRKRGIVMKVGSGVLKGRCPQLLEALDIPRFQVGFLSFYTDRKIDKI